MRAVASSAKRIENRSFDALENEAGKGNGRYALNSIYLVHIS